MDVDVELRMDAVYAYHFAGNILNFHVDQAFAYLGTEPFGEFGIRLAGYATAQWGKGSRTNLVPTLTFPGMSVAGLLTVGPSLDVYGEVSRHRTFLLLFELILQHTTNRELDQREGHFEWPGTGWRQSHLWSVRGVLASRRVCPEGL